MTILGIETSCDETSAAIYSDRGLLSNEISSQVVHKKYGGVVPELASRAHVQQIMPVVDAALDDAHLTLDDISGLAVTYGPGLVGAILVGLNFVKGMALALNKPFIGINHIEGHIFANYIEGEAPELPFINLVISGGHTMLVLVEEHGRYKIMGRTHDDAAGEAFDKVAKMLDLGYPGGPAVSKIALNGDPNYERFPKGRFKDFPYDFSFSGLKTAVLYHIQKLSSDELEKHRADIAASFQRAAVDVLVERTFALLDDLKIKTLSVVGGVAANKLLREKLERRANAGDVKLFIPPPILCTDNAAMIARAGYFHLNRNEKSAYSLSPNPSLTL